MYSNGIQQYYHFFTRLMGILWSSAHGIWRWATTIFNHCASLMSIFWWALIVCGCNTFHIYQKKPTVSIAKPESLLHQEQIQYLLLCALLENLVHSLRWVEWLIKQVFMIELPNPCLLQRVQSSRHYTSKAGYSDKPKMALHMHYWKNCERPF